MVDIDALVKKCKEDGASDLHLICGLPPKYRKDGQLVDMSDIPLTKEDCEQMARELAGNLGLKNREDPCIITLLL